MRLVKQVKTHNVLRLTVILLSVFLVWNVCHYKAEVAELKSQIVKFQSMSVKKRIMVIQTMTGCKKIDGEIGPESTEKFNAAVEVEDKQRHNEFAKQYFTPSGAPRKE